MKSRRSGGRALVLALALASCVAPARGLDPFTAIADYERFDLLEDSGIEIFTAPSRRLAPSFLRTTFVARQQLGHESPALLTDFRVTVWIDANGDGEQQAIERSRSASAVEPTGMQGVVHQITAPFEPGLPMAWEFEATIGGERVTRAGRLAY